MSEWDARWVEKVRQGDDGAFDKLVGRHRERVISVIRSKIGDLDLAMDLAQEAFVRAYMSLESLRDPDRFGPWIVGIAENLCRMQLRKQREVAVSNDVLDQFNSQIQPLLLPGYGALAPGTRAVAELYFGQSKRMKEIADELQISLSAVKSRIRDARRNLQKEMQPVKTAPKPTRQAFDKELKRRLELARWFRQFAFKASNGIPLMQILDELSKDDYSKVICEATSKMREKIVGQGVSMSAVMKELPIFITPETTAMVRAGEIGGILDEAANILADWIDVSSAKSQIELSFWLRSIGSLIDAGVPLDMALAWGVEYPVNPGATAVLEKLIEAIENNQPLAPIVDEAPDIFSHPIRLAIRAGEKDQCLGFAFHWAGMETALSICSQLLGVEAIYTNRSTKETEEAFTVAIAKYTQSECAEDRRSAIHILCSLEAFDFLDHIAVCLTDSYSSVRLSAIHALARLKDTDHLDALAKCLDDESDEVKMEVLVALADLRATQWAETMSYMIRDKNPAIGHAAVESVLRLDQEETLVRVSSEILLSDAPEGHLMAIHVLQDDAEEVDIDVLLHALKDKRQVAMCAAFCLVDHGRDEGLALMREAIATGYMSYWAAVWLEKAKDVQSAPLIRDAVNRGELHLSWMERADKLDSLTQ